jgi:hypothetical protein
VTGRSGAHDQVGQARLRLALRLIQGPALTPPESCELSPFKQLSGPPKNVNMTHALGQIAALHELHPGKRQSDRKFCDRMERQLKAGKKIGGSLSIRYLATELSSKFCSYRNFA